MKTSTAPFFVFEVTSLCNINCLFCYNVWKETSYPPNESGNSLSLDEIKQLIAKIVSDLAHEGEKPLGFALAGGEPLLHPDIVEISSCIRAHQIPVNIVTNGILLSREKIREFREVGVSHFEISLPEISEEGYKQITKSASVTKVRKTLLNLKEIHPQAHLTVAITLTRLNAAAVGEIIDLCFAFSVDAVVLNRFVPGGEGLCNKETLTLSDKELVEVLTIANEKSHRFNLPINVAVPVEDCLIPHSNYPYLTFGSCSCGTGKWVLDPEGNLRICEQNPEILGNARTDSVIDLMKMKQVELFRENSMKDSCSSCSKYSECGGGCRFVR